MSIFGLPVVAGGAIYIAFEETIGVLEGGPEAEAATAVAAATLTLAVFTIFLWRRAKGEVAAAARPLVVVAPGGEGAAALASADGRSFLRVVIVNRSDPPGVVTAVRLVDRSAAILAESRRSIPLLAGEERSMEVPLAMPPEAIPADAVLSIHVRDANGRLGQTLFAVRRRGDALTLQSCRRREAHPRETEDHNVLPAAILAEAGRGYAYRSRSRDEPAFRGTARIRAALAPGRKTAMTWTSIGAVGFGYVTVHAALDLADDPSAQWAARVAVWLVCFCGSALVAILSARTRY